MTTTPDRKTQAHPRKPGKASHLDDAIEMALGLQASRGDLRALNVLQKRRQHFEADAFPLGPLETPSDLLRAQRDILRAAADGRISAKSAKQLGEQVDLIGRAIERQDMAMKLDALREKIGASRSEKITRSLENEIEKFSNEVDRFIIKDTDQWDKFLNEHGDDAILALITGQILSKLHLLSGMEAIEFIDQGLDNHLPRSLQDLFDSFNNLNEPNLRGRRRLALHSRVRIPGRFTPQDWTCVCKSNSTFWVESDLRLPDSIQIYCAACFKCSGWGTHEEFDQAHHKGHATWVDRSNIDVISKLKPAPVAGIKATLKRINFVMSSDTDTSDERP